jgi:hypothetical protein
MLIEEASMEDRTMIWVKSIMVGLGAAVGGAGLLVIAFIALMSIKARQLPVGIRVDAGGGYFLLDCLALLFLLGFSLTYLRLRHRRDFAAREGGTR